MKRLILMATSLVLTFLVAFPQESSRREEEVRLPSGRLQTDVILEADHEKSLEDAEELLELAKQLRDELAENEYSVLSVDAIRSTEKIEKLAKQIRNRMKRF